MGTLLRTLIRGAGYSVIRKLGLPKTIAIGAVALISLWLLSGDAMAAQLQTCMSRTVAIAEVYTCDIETHGAEVVAVLARGHGVTGANVFATRKADPYMGNGTTLAAIGLTSVTTANGGLGCTGVSSGGDQFHGCLYYTAGLDRIRVGFTNSIGTAHTVTIEYGRVNESVSTPVSNFPATQAVTGTFWQATQPISGTVAISGGGGGGGGEVQIDPAANTVSLSDADRNRSDLAWWGAWAIVGLLLALLIAPRFSNLLDPTRGL